MKLYLTKSFRERRVEISLDFYELNQMINALSEFKEQIVCFKRLNTNAVGFTHLHFKDCGLIDSQGKEDVVLYIDLSKIANIDFEVEKESK